MSVPEGNSYFRFPESPNVSRDEIKGNIRTRGKTKLFHEGTDIKCFVIFLDFHFNSNKRITGANQNSRHIINDNTNLILKITE